MFLVAGLIWLFGCQGIDKLKHPEEWKDAGNSGERIVYNTLVNKLNIPENQILRNVYIPTKDGKTSEIDLLLVSKKGIFVIECKNYGGNIYGDANRPKWIQYIGHQKNYFYSPLLQNKNHAKYLKDFLAENKIEVPIIPLVSTITRGNWKINNLKSDDYILGYNCHLKDVYNDLPDLEQMSTLFKPILAKLTLLSRPGEDIKEKHINDIKNNVPQFSPLNKSPNSSASDIIKKYL